MKIIYIHTNQWVTNSPSTTFVTYNAVGMAQNNVETHLIVKNASEGETSDILHDVFDLELPEYLQIHRVFNVNSNRQFYRKSIKLIKKIADEETFIITRAIGFLPHLLLLRTKINFKLFFETHDFYYDLKIRSDIQRSKKIKTSLQERLFLPHVDGLICLLETQKNLYTKYLPNLPIYVLPTGLEKIYPANSKLTSNNLAYIGSLDKLKGVNQILSLAKLLDESYHITIIGGKTTEEISKFEQQVASQGLSNKITITGWVNKAELHNKLGDIKIGLIPIRDTFFNAHLTSPLKLFDFYSHGIPVIASDLPTLRELVDDGQTGFLVDWENLDNVKEQIEKTVSNPELYKVVNLSIEKKAQALLWRNRGKKLIELLSE